MANPTWPADLPGWIVDGYGYQPVAAFIRTAMDNGQARQRRRFISVPTSLTIKALFTRAQLDVFESWWDNTIGAGAAWALMPVTNGAGTVNATCRFTAVYQVAPEGGTNLWTVTAPIETMSMPRSS